MRAASVVSSGASKALELVSPRISKFDGIQSMRKVDTVDEWSAIGHDCGIGSQIGQKAV